jgi:hypothetical protein
VSAHHGRDVRFLHARLPLCALGCRHRRHRRRSATTVGSADAADRVILKKIKAADKGQLAVSEEDGRFLRVLIATRRAKSILEIGAASGYSGIWLGSARGIGGRVVAIEYDPQRAKEAAANITLAGSDRRRAVVHGDAFKEIPKLPGTFDFVFLDAWKPDYKKFFDMVYPALNPAGSSRRTTSSTRRARWSRSSTRPEPPGCSRRSCRLGRRHLGLLQIK